MEERGFDVLTKGQGAILLIASTILLTLIILAGGLLMRYLDMQSREARRRERERESTDPGHGEATRS